MSHINNKHKVRQKISRLHFPVVFTTVLDTLRYCQHSKAVLTNLLMSLNYGLRSAGSVNTIGKCCKTLGIKLLPMPRPWAHYLSTALTTNPITYVKTFHDDNKVVHFWCLKTLNSNSICATNPTMIHNKSNEWRLSLRVDKSSQHTSHVSQLCE